MRTFDDKYSMMEDLRSYIDTHLRDDLEPKELAAMYGYAYGSFRVFFKNVTGTTIHQYVRLRRMHHAAILLRQGANVNEAFRESGFQTLSGFIRSFYTVFGVSPYEYAATRGAVLMSEPEVRVFQDFFVVGNAFPALPDLSWTASGAYWQGQTFPAISAEDFARIDMGKLGSVGVWTRRDGEAIHVFGVGTEHVSFVPPLMLSVGIPGGEFLSFPVPPYQHNVELGENIRATWYYAYEQWIPDSDYAVDWMRLPFEFYQDDRNTVCIPILRKTEAFSGAPPDSCHPPVLLQGSRGRWDRWDDENEDVPI